jgi:hypothetical protein
VVEPIPYLVAEPEEATEPEPLPPIELAPEPEPEPELEPVAIPVAVLNGSAEYAPRPAAPLTFAEFVEGREAWLGSATR